ncbi:hypothetical protein [Chitinilyticum piscinae]|uniref:Uncharacterized protein n=1 Tax=Chitinilyticum piscinae TaxID=2866724 RepID=A0A8J7KD36_9NEIS|nr:hypothetical protein [Chitinilyticum piscinae]MBE9608379.1 hypothetical protein [Chitinilyticum piscinae]
MMFAPVGELGIALLAYLLIYLLPPLSILLLVAFQRDWRLAQWLRRHRVVLRGIQMLLLLGYALIGLVVFDFRQSAREGAIERAQADIRRHPVLAQASMVRGILAPAGSKIDLGYSEDWNEASSAEFSSPVSWQGLQLTHIDWRYDRLSLAAPGQVDGWHCAAGESLATHSLSDMPLRLAYCTLASLTVLPDITLPAGTRVQSDIYVPENSCMVRWTAAANRALETGSKAPAPADCADSKEEGVVAVWLLHIPETATRIRWKNQGWHTLTLKLDMQSGKVLDYGGETATGAHDPAARAVVKR